MVESIGELDRAIRNELGFNDDDMNQYILFEEHEDHFTVKYKRWLAPSMGGLRLKDFLVEKLGAKYEPYPKATFIIEKGRKAETPETAISTERSHPDLKELQPAKNNNKKPFDLKASVDLLPMLKEARPIIQDEKGVNIDGWHRQKIDKDWPTKTVPIKDEFERMMARFALNFCRRNLTEKEKRDAMVAFHLKTGWSPKEMADKLPVSYSFVMKYLPEEYKHKEFVELGSKGGVASVASRREAKGESQETRQRIPCEKCGVAPANPFEGHNLCDRHIEEAKENPDVLKSLPKPLHLRKIGDDAKEYKPKDTWAYRKSLMSLPESKVDVDALKEIQARGHKVVYQPRICLVWTQLEYLVDDKAYFYNDGRKVHKGKEERDDKLREMLANKEKKLVYGIPYDVYSKKTIKAIADFVEEKVGKIE